MSAPLAGVGQKFPQVELFDARGGPFPRSAAPGIMLFFFFKTDCATSAFALPFVERIHRLAAEGRFRVLGISQDPPEATAAWFSSQGATFASAFDPEPWPASAACGLATVPAFFLVSENGDILDRAIGFDRRRLEEFARIACGTSERPYSGLFAPGEAVPALRPG